MPAHDLSSYSTDSNPTRRRYAANVAAFEAVCERYIDARFYCPPIRSSLAGIDPTNPAAARRWSPDVAILIADVERAVEHALRNDKSLTERFNKFVPAETAATDQMKVTVQEQHLDARMRQLVGSEFRRRGLYPLPRYYGIPRRSPRD